MQPTASQTYGVFWGTRAPDPDTQRCGYSRSACAARCGSTRASDRCLLVTRGLTVLGRCLAQKEGARFVPEGVRCILASPRGHPRWEALFATQPSLASGI